MIAIALCIVSFIACYWAGRRSLAQGLIALFAVGYFYGILRANVLSPFSHFTFDAGMLGVYATQNWISPGRGDKGNPGMRLWLILLIGWPVLICFMPFQPLMVSLVGLRANIYFLPMLLLGSRLKENDVFQLANGLVLLNLIALGFAGAEYFTSVQQFYPYSPVTEIIYNSADAGGGFFRIPAIFTSAHAFGGTMCGTVPILICAWIAAPTPARRRFALVGIGAALLGILLSATRINFVVGSAAVVGTIFTARMKTSSRVLFLVLIGGLAFATSRNVRFQRFTSLADTSAVTDRIAGSVNRGFWELLTEYPMGNGLGGGGTSIPYFLQGQVRNPIGLESEYSRILCEQGIVGLLLWIAFIIWYIASGSVVFRKGPFRNQRRLVWVLAILGFGIGLIGVGGYTSIPQTVLSLITMSWAITPSMFERRNESMEARYGAAVPLRGAI